MGAQSVKVTNVVMGIQVLALAGSCDARTVAQIAKVADAAMGTKVLVRLGVTMQGWSHYAKMVTL